MSMSAKKATVQATCKEMKAEVDKAASVHNYGIKAKHMTTMQNFFSCKNFELQARRPSPPQEPPVKGKPSDPKAAK